jgi:uncharacterized protein
MKKTFLILAILTSSWLTPAISQSAEKLRPMGPVSDFAGVLDAETSDKINAVIAELDQKTSAEIAVVTVKNLGGDNIDNYAVNLFKDWGIGKKGKDNGILILAAIEDRKARIEVGYGLEGVINDAKAGDILRSYVFPNFKKESYGEGLFEGTLAVAGEIANSAGVKLTFEAPEQPAAGIGLSPLAIVFRVLIFLVLLIFFIRHPVLFLLFFGMGRRGGGMGGGFGGGGGGGFGGGGFGGGMSGGGGASGGW